MLRKVEITPKGTTIEQALLIIIKQLKVNGYRPRTLKCYNDIFKKFQGINDKTYLEEINTKTIYKWLDSLNIAAKLFLIDHMNLVNNSN
ncbi:hypothetical protein [Psychrobacillus sp. OK032]|uniref:hypothetical protein n=1 Tax=Psychrobacillus sp. OK032 TaxID=1884358 RepID=UPI000B8525F5|nr:hypothetical protein [Psychrobacillus sp. OK032]